MNAIVKKIQLGDKELVIDIGKIAKQADGSCFLRYGDTVVLVTAVADKNPKEGIPFLPLTVDYREKTYASGRFPGGFFKREGRPTTTEILTCRIIDRSIRPLFPKGWNFESQVIGMVLSADTDNNPDVLASTAASIALSISNIPFEGPMATVRVGRIDGQFIVNPTYSQLEESSLDLVVSATKEAINMVEGEADELSESELVDALMFAHEQCQPLISAQEELISSIGKENRTFEKYEIPESLTSEVTDLSANKVEQALAIKDKLDRYAAIDVIVDDIHSQLEEKHEDNSNLEQDVHEIIDQVKRVQVRQTIANQQIRLDGRGLTEVRPISIELGILPRAHGSALFTRGETQSIVTTTLGTAQDEQLIEDLQGEHKEHFLLHYNFPPFSTGEVKFMRGPGRREIGHGALAERALRKLLPDHEDFSYSIRIVSEITESNGSSSMATVCGGSLSLMDAGVKVKKPVAGVAMGMIKEGDEFFVLTDILGDEDHLGDMDFKVTGTRDGITAVQMDIKISGVTREILNKALEQAKHGRLHILDKMHEAIAAPREDLSPYAPRITTIKVNPDKIRDIIGPGGRVIKDIVAQTGCKIDVEDDGTVRVGSSDPEAAKQALKIIKELTQEAEIGKLYMGTVKKITDFGAFCEVLPGTDGLLHISELSNKRVEKVTDVVSEGDEVLVKVIGIDRQGKIRLSRKEALGQQLEES
jgi:polyribonucleotide nucleotidyltransferase